VQYRLPYRLIRQLLADLPGLSLSPGAVARQMQRGTEKGTSTISLGRRLRHRDHAAAIRRFIRRP
jgi:hypothetical protein